MRIQKQNYSTRATIFLFCAILEGSTKSPKFFPCGALAEEKKHKIYVFQCASHKKLRCAYTAWKKIQKNKNSWTPLEAHLVFRLSSKTNYALLFIILQKENVGR